MKKYRNISIAIVLLLLITLSIYIFAFRNKPIDTKLTPAQADISNFDAVSAEVLAYFQIVKSKRDLSDGEFDRLMEISKAEPLGGPSVMAVSAAVAHVNTVDGANHDKRKNALIVMSLAMLNRKDPSQSVNLNSLKDEKEINEVKAKRANDDNVKATAICCLRDLDYQEARNLIQPYLKHNTLNVALAAKKYFEKIDAKK